LAPRGKIFISYRREDAPADARGLCERLSRVYGASNVFMDVDRLTAGQRFEQELDRALGKCDVLIAVIGSRWMALLDEYAQQGRRDYVREEIAAALQREMVVVPVLVGREASVPTLPLAPNLPENIRDLVAFQKVSVTHETFRRDTDELVAALKKVLKHKYGPQRPWRRMVAAAVVALILAGGAYTYWTEIVRLQRALDGQPSRLAEENTAEREANTKLAAEKAAAEKAAAERAAAEKAAVEKVAREDAARKRAELEAKQRQDAEKAAADEARKKAEADARAAAEKKAADERRVAEERKTAEEKKQRDADAAQRLAAANLVTDCDRLAAAPHDRDRPAGVAGIINPNVIDVAASAACDDAMRRFPTVARFAYEAGRSAMSRQDYARAGDLFREAITKGSAAAYVGAGVLYLRGLGVTRDYDHARNLFETGIARGDTTAMVNLGFMFQRGFGVAQDYTRARDLYERSASNGDASGMGSLGEMYEAGYGVAQNYATARYWYERGAGLGSPRSMRGLGFLYAGGLGVAQDYQQGRRWYEKAAALGDTQATYFLGNLHSNAQGVR
jgi:hypothetical protein